MKEVGKTSPYFRQKRRHMGSFGCCRRLVVVAHQTPKTTLMAGGFSEGEEARLGKTRPSSQTPSLACKKDCHGRDSQWGCPPHHHVQCRHSHYDQISYLEACVGANRAGRLIGVQ